MSVRVSGHQWNSTLRIIAVHMGDAVVVRAVPASVAFLTEREKEILAALADGHTAHAIARRLTISERTVHKHLEHLYAKIGVHDRLEAVGWRDAPGSVEKSNRCNGSLRIGFIGADGFDHAHPLRRQVGEG